MRHFYQKHFKDESIKQKVVDLIRTMTFGNPEILG